MVYKNLKGIFSDNLTFDSLSSYQGQVLLTIYILPN